MSLDEPQVTIGYSVLASRLSGLKLSDPDDWLEVLMVVQGGKPLPLESAGVRVLELTSFGVAKSRNVVLEQARGRYVVFADDDSRVLHDGIARIMDYFRRHPEVALVLGTSVDFDGRKRKRAPRWPTRLSRLNSARAGTIEMMVDRTALAAAGIRFDESFGAGTPNYLGDEYILISDALRAGLRCVSLPVALGVHSAASSGTRFGSVEDARARSAVITRVFGRWAPAIRLAFVFRHARSFGSLRLGCRFVIGRLRD